MEDVDVVVVVLGEGEVVVVEGEVEHVVVVVVEEEMGAVVVLEVVEVIDIVLSTTFDLSSFRPLESLANDARAVALSLAEVVGAGAGGDDERVGSSWLGVLESARIVDSREIVGEEVEVEAGAGKTPIVGRLFVNVGVNVFFSRDGSTEVGVARMRFMWW